MSYKFIDGGVTSPQGFQSSGIHCGLKKNKNKNDLALIYSEIPCNAAAVYTTNVVKGAPIVVTKKHLDDNKAQAVIINSGNANTCTGDDGISKAKKMCNAVAEKLHIPSYDVLVASTGVIGVPLNIDAIVSGTTSLVENLSTSYTDSSKAIMTTDTFAKTAAVEVNIDGTVVTIGAMCKGSGMIEPNMATMLSFITTDINISSDLLQKALTNSVKKSYNCISVDGDTSTNDMVIMLANGLADNKKITEENEDYNKFIEALNALNVELAKMIARDGEGATKLIQCDVYNADSYEKAYVLSKSVINSPLVKTAMFGADANWGRVLCAIGYSGEDFDPNLVDVTFKSNEGSIDVCSKGLPINFDEDLAKKILSCAEINILVNLNSGNYSATTWGCDLSYDYVKINGDYRS